MGDEAKERDKLLAEIAELRQRISELQDMAVERERAEEALRRGEEYFWAVTENTLDIVLLIDAEGVIKYINSASRDILGYSPEEMIGRDGFDFLHPDDVERAAGVFERSFQEADYSPLVEFRVRHKDGSWRSLEGIGSNFTEHPAVEGIVVSFRDITDRKRAEESLRESEEMHRTLVGISPDAITVSDMNGIITYVSPQTLRLHGFDREEELLGISSLMLAAPEERERGMLKLAEVIQEGSMKNVEFTALRKDGTSFILEMNAALIRDPEGEPKSIVAFTRDVTERKRIERELHERNEELEAFAHTISHDLLTPVAIVEGYSKAALEAHREGAQETERECLESIIKGANRMSDLIESLLQYARAGHLETQTVQVEPEELLLEVLTDLEGEIFRKGVSVTIENDLPPVLVDRIKLRQAFFNLIINAVRHMGDVPEPAVEIGAAIEGATVVFHVRDNGAGIPRDLQEKIFEPFRHFSVDGSLGLGIGLSTVERAVLAWGGRVWVESRPGEGATFFFTAPLA